ncbi:MAG: hypothetical protein M3406_14350 [Chloroflexota bacterium]|nr:hypothetical protein [Chloroflexota bacterium]
MPPYEIVPLIIDPPAPRAKIEDMIVLNLGGLSSWLMPPHVQELYATIMVQCVANALGPNTRIQVTTGQHIVDALDSAPILNHPVEYASMAHEAYLAVLRSARCYIGAAGLRAIYEAFAGEVPTMFLPPQNLSQERTLTTLAGAGLARGRLTWKSIYEVNLEGLSEPEACALINDCIVLFAEDAPARDSLTRDIASFLDLPVDTRPQSQFLQDQGGIGGAKVVAAKVLDLVLA